MGGIVGLLSGGFIRLVIIAVVIAGPLALWTMNRWLQNFAYRIDLGWELILYAGLVAIGIAVFGSKTGRASAPPSVIR